MSTAASQGLPLGGRIKWAREQAGLSHDRLAERVGSSRRHLIRLEQGVHRPGPRLAALIAEATGQPQELFSDEDDEESDSLTLDDFLRLRVRQILREERAFA